MRRGLGRAHMCHVVPTCTAVLMRAMWRPRVQGHLETYHAELDEELDEGAATGDGLKARLFKLIQAI